MLIGHWFLYVQPFNNHSKQNVTRIQGQSQCNALKSYQLRNCWWLEFVHFQFSFWEENEP